MSTITETYTLKYELSFAPEYRWTECGKCFNVKTGRGLKQSHVSGNKKQIQILNFFEKALSKD